jgi:negative regulator of flagellin synthesis FlgM
MPEEKVALSAQAKEYRAVKELVDKTPEIREEKIRELQSRIDSGSYRVPAEDIAKKIVGDNLLDLFA